MFLQYLEGIVCRKVNIEEIHSASIRAVGRTHDGCLPLKKVVTCGSRTTI